MSLEQLDQIIAVHLSTADDFPDEMTIKAAFQQSMVMGADHTVKYIKSMNIWEVARPILQDAIQDIPLEENPEIAGRIFNVMETLYPKFIIAVASSPKKVTHAGDIISKLIKEIRNGT
ncbi:hypothetical protein [Mesotoga prima]|jgi:hypothetical protein|uniref:hypothetical protein n=1 Tax=Mesotoga prima TaxID=1184387 RepID=UPI000503FFD7